MLAFVSSRVSTWLCDDDSDLSVSEGNFFQNSRENKTSNQTTKLNHQARTQSKHTQEEKEEEEEEDTSSSSGSRQ